MPMVRIPISLATFATIGPAPVPVPPPIDAVTKAIFVPSLSSSRMRSNVCSASLRPSSGLPPTPKPSLPNSKRTGTGQADSCWLSVLHTANVTFAMPSIHMLRTALQPPPPTPITLIIPTDMSLGILKSMPTSDASPERLTSLLSSTPSCFFMISIFLLLLKNDVYFYPRGNVPLQS